MKLLGLTFRLIPFAALALPLAAQTNTFPTSGNVGIGTTSPSYPLHVVGSANTWKAWFGGPDGYIMIGPANSGWAHIYTDRSNFIFNQNVWSLTGGFSSYDLADLTLQTNGITRVAIQNSSGNVGIGRTSPSTPLDVNGTIQLVRTANNARAFQFSLENGTADIVWPSGAGYPLRFGTGSVSSFSELMRIADSGNVGIGTVSPQSRLHISTLSSADAALGQRWSYNGADSSYYLDLKQTVTSGVVRWNFSQVNAGSAYNDVLVLDRGNVGIGTTNPTQKLSVNGTIQTKEVIVQTGWSDYVFEDGYRLASLSEVEQRIKAERHLPGIPSAKEVAEHGVSVGEMQSKLLAKIEELTLHVIAQEKQLAAQQEEIRALRASRR